MNRSVTSAEILSLEATRCAMRAIGGCDMENIRLPKAKWNQLDDLLGEHGFGGYYDLVECLKIIAGDLGISATGVDLGSSMSLPQIVQFLQDWATILSRTDGFRYVIEEAASEAEPCRAN